MEFSKKQQTLYRHAQYYQQILEQANDVYATYSPDSFVSSLAIFDNNTGQIQSAWDWLIAHKSSDEEIQKLICRFVAKAEEILEIRQNPTERIEWVNHAITISKQLKSTQWLSNHYNQLANSYEDIGQFDDAQKAYERALELSREQNEKQVEGVVLGNLGLLHSHFGRNDEALKHYKMALAIAREVENIRDEMVALNNIGSIYLEIGQYDLAYDYHSRALNIARETNNKLSISQSLRNIANVLGFKNQFDDAHAMYLEALQVARNIPDQELVGDCLIGLANLLALTDDNNRALDYANEAFKVFESLKYPEYIASVLNTIGKIHSDTGQLEQAIEYHSRALKIASDLGTVRHKLDAKNGLGLAALEQADFKVAMRFFQDTLSLAQNMGDPDSESAALSNMADACLGQGDYEQAIQHARRAVEINSRLSNSDANSSDYLTLAIAYAQQEKYQESLDCLREARRFAEEVERFSRAFYCYEQEGELLEILNYDADAAICYRQAMHLADHTGNYERYSQFLLDAVRMHTRQNQYYVSLPLLRQLLFRARRRDDNINMAMAWNAFGYSYHGIGYYDIALHCYAKALALFQKEQHHDMVATVLYNTGYTHGILGDIATCKRHWQQARELWKQLDDRDMVDFLDEELKLLDRDDEV